MDAMILSQNPPARKENHLGEEREACGMGSLHFEIGKKFTLTKTFAESDVYLFAGIIGDLFPAHVNEEYCKPAWSTAASPSACAPPSAAWRGWTAAMTFWPWDMTR